MQKDDVRKWIKSKKLDGKGIHVLTGKLVAQKTGFRQRYCNLLLEEFVIEGLLQSKKGYVYDDMGHARINKLYWKR